MPAFEKLHLLAAIIFEICVVLGLVISNTQQIFLTESLPQSIRRDSCGYNLCFCQN